MKINIKNLKGEVFSFQIDPQQTILELKEKIQNLKGHVIQTQKIIFKGKAVNNTDTIEQLSLKQTDFLVLMTQVAKPPPKPKVEEKVEEPVQKIQAKKETKNEAQLNQLMAMGFPRQQCVAALQAAFNDGNRAVDYLLNGIPQSPNINPQNVPSQFNLQNLANHPQLNRIRQALQQNPSSLPQILAGLSQTSPQLFQLIQQHPEQFEQLLEGGQLQIQQQEEQQQQEGLIVTQEQQAAINRLVALGFSRLEAAQAYIACDKNEELAANLLFERLANGDIESGPQQEDDDNLFN